MTWKSTSTTLRYRPADRAERNRGIHGVVEIAGHTLYVDAALIDVLEQEGRTPVVGDLVAWTTRAGVLHRGVVQGVLPPGVPAGRVLGAELRYREGVSQKYARLVVTSKDTTGRLLAHAVRVSSARIIEAVS